MPHLSARACKATLVLNADELTMIDASSTPRVTLTVTVPELGFLVTADVAGKSLRKCQAQIAEHGNDGVVVILQGKLTGVGKMVDAGLVAQVKVKPPVEAAA
jgi:hypothetical protein